MFTNSSFASDNVGSEVAARKTKVAAQRQLLRQQQKELESLQRTLNEQARIVRDQQKRLQVLENQISFQHGAFIAENSGRDRVASSVPSHLLDADLTSRAGGVETTRDNSPYSPRATRSDDQVPVGEMPLQTDRPPEVPAIPELGGVLTPRGQLVLEPTLQYGNTQLNRFTFRGVQILDTFLIGLLEAEDADRDFMSVGLSGRYGITNRLEFELKIPYVYRDEQLSATVPQANEDITITRSLDGEGIGDIELAMHYQLNQGLDGWPFFIGNLRYKSTTGEGLFDVRRDADGVQTEVATGSGFESFEPSVTVLYPSDPAVFFGNLGYLFNLEDKIDRTFGEQTIGTVDPGDAWRMSFGLAYGINERASATLGYKHDFIDETKSEINGADFSSAELDVGALLLGFSHSLPGRLAINLNLELGVTDDAPDVLMTWRVPFSRQLF